MSCKSEISHNNIQVTGKTNFASNLEKNNMYTKIRW